MTQETTQDTTGQRIVVPQDKEFQNGLKSGTWAAQYANGYNVGYNTTIDDTGKLGRPITYTQTEVDEIKTVAYKRGFLDGINLDVLLDMIPDLDDLKQEVNQE